MIAPVTIARPPRSIALRIATGLVIALHGALLFAAARSGTGIEDAFARLIEGISAGKRGGL